MQGRWEELLTASTSPLLSTLCQFYRCQPSNAHKIPHLGYLPCTGKGGWYTVDRSSHCCWRVSSTSLDAEARYEKLPAASTSLVLFALCHFLLGQFLKCTQNTTLGHPLCKRNEMISCKERQILLLKSFIPFCRCTGKMIGISESISQPYMCQTVSLMSKLTLNLHIKCRIWGTLSAGQNGCYSMRQEIHCYWSGS